MTKGSVTEKKISAINPFAKGRKLYCILRHKCPACQQGNLFLHRNPYNLKMLDKMPAQCPVCGEDFRREPGFYYGAMMISHALTTVMAVIIHFTVFHFYGWQIAPHLIFLLSFIIGLFPLVFRTARAIWISLFVKYKGVI
ncbi:MAG: DUF983 domain-containing protein [Bacteroidia bacterium]